MIIGVLVCEAACRGWVAVTACGAADEAGQRREVTVAAEPDLTVGGDLSLHFDTRTAVPVRIDTPLPAQSDHIGVPWHRVAGARSDLTGWSYNVAFSFSRAIQQAQRRTDYVNTRGITWLHQATADAEWLSAPMGITSALPRTYRPGERTSEVWFPALTRPALPATDPDLPAGAPVNRAHDAIRVAIPHYADGGVGAYGWIDNRSDRTQLTLRRDDGTVVGQSTAAHAQFTAAPGDERYRLTLDVARDRVTGRQWWTTSTATSTTWTFHSRRPRTSAPAVLPLLQVGLDIGTDLSNAVDATRAYPLVLRPGYQPGARGPGGFTAAVRFSYDDGAQWTAARMRGRTATIPAAPRGAQFATIQVTAEDRAGNRIEQTITRAWKVHPPTP